MRALLTVFLLHALSLASCQSHYVHEERAAPLTSALNRQRIENNAVLPMRISLRQDDHAILNSEKWLMAVSDPDSSQYGQHWTQAEVHTAFQPSDASVTAVTAWLAEHGITEYARSENLQWLVFEIPAGKAEALLQTQYFEHQDSKHRFKVSCDEYSLPVSLRDHIDFVTPGVMARDITGRTQRSRDHLRTVLQRLPQSPPPAADPPYPIKNRDLPSVSKSFAPYPTGQSKHHRPPFPADDLTHCSRSVSPACIRALYNFTTPDPSKPVSQNNSMGIFEEWSITRQGDMNKFFSYYTDIPEYTSPIFDSIDGAIVRPNQTLGWRKDYSRDYPWFIILAESTLDLQLAFPIVYPQTVTVFQTDDSFWAGYLNLHSHQTGFFNDFLDAIDGSYCTYKAFGEKGNNATLDPTYPDPRPHGYKGKLQCGAFKPTNVISISYDLHELDTPWFYQKRQCLEFLKLGLQGVSVFVASGDAGVGYCTRGPIGDRLFGPNTPAACPWITSVGATHIQKNTSVYAPEAAVYDAYTHSGWSGGGFSIVHDRPSYQNKAVSTYFDTADLDIPYFTDGQFKNTTGRYNRNGRGFPDIAAVGIEIANIIELDYIANGGTSASTPIVASLFNRIIEERIRAGKTGPLGFVNPALYKNAGSLNDILMGGNRYTCTEGFKCVKGWDPVTGLGTPNYPKLLETFLNLP